MKLRYKVLLSMIFAMSMMSELLLAQEAPSEVIGNAWESARVPWYTWPVSASRSFTKDTLSISANQPFFDDFSSGVIPDSNKWDLLATIDPRYPTITKATAVNPPSLGALTFDGASPVNQPYQGDVTRGPADRLESHFINLQPYGPANDLALSFFLQPQGVGHAPTFRDSFIVYVNALVDNTGDSTHLVKIFSQGGSTVTDFKQHIIRLDDPLYFHTQFYLVFENIGYLNGLLHAWNLDYITLGLFRSLGDTVYNDVSVNYLSRPPMDPYTAIPFQQYKASTFMQPFKVEGSYLGGGSPNVSVSGKITDPVGNNLPSPYTQSANTSLSSKGPFQVDFSDYQDQTNLVNPYASTFRHEVKITGPADDHPENDGFVQDYRIDTLLAYDDGEADVAYGLNRASGFGQKFEIESEDSLMAVWICFVPQIHFLLGGSLEETDFRLSIWKDPDTDSILYAQSQDMQVAYGDTINHFQRYPIKRALSVSGTIWIGITQVNSAAIGVGFDRSYPNNDLVSWDSSGVWVSSQLNGTLMIRPEMRNILYNGGPFTGMDADLEHVLPDLRLYPNPASQQAFSLQASGLSSVQKIEVEIFDVSGRKLALDTSADRSSYQLGTQVSPGVYMVRISGIQSNGTPFTGIRKWILQP